MVAITGSAKRRIASLLDPNSFIEIGGSVIARSTDFNMQAEKAASDGVLTGYGTIDGNLVYVYGQERTFTNLVKHSFYRSTYTVRMIWESLYDLVTGRYGIEAVSGPVGVTEAEAKIVPCNRKMIDAWNQMVYMNDYLSRWLFDHRDDYGGYFFDNDMLETINQFGI